MTFIPATDRDDFDVADVGGMPESVQEDFLALARRYINTSQMVKSATERRKELRDSLLPFLERYGADDAGSQSLELPEAMHGVGRLRRQRRAKKELDSAAAERLLTERKIMDKYTKTVTVLDEDAIMAGLYTGDLTEEDIDAMFPTTVTFALEMK